MSVKTMSVGKSWAVILVALVVSGCGGGAGDGDGSNVVLPPVATGFSLSGQLGVPGDVLVDGDTNDLNAPLAVNNSLAQAQVLPNPFVVSGFVTDASTGLAGDRFASSKDEFDVYRVSLRAGQRVRLQIADWDAADTSVVDLDLHIYPPGQDKPLLSAVGEQASEELTIPADDEYLLVVAAFSGQSNYVLLVSDTLDALSGEQLRTSEGFVPGEALFGLSATASRQSLQAQGIKLPVSAAGGAGGPALLRFDEFFLARSASQSAKQTRLLAAVGASLTPEQAERLDTLYRIKQLAQQPGIEYASPNYIRQRLMVPNDPLYREQWHYSQINMEHAWDLALGSGAIVAVIDTGVFLAHQDLRANLTAGYDFVSQVSNAVDGDGIDANPDDPGDGAHGGQSSWHGTHVAGTVAAVTGNNIGVAGVAPQAKIMPLRVLGSLGGTDYDIAQAMRFAARLTNDSGTLPPQKADVINMSLGGPSFSAPLQRVVDEVRATGVIVVAAAGNDNTSVLFYPASYNGVVSVSAVGRDGERATYSNFGSQVDVAAPGGDLRRDSGVLSTLVSDIQGRRESAYDANQGTSMAAPHVAGVVALMRSVNPKLTPADFDALLAKGSIVRDLGPAGRDDRFGHGLIDAQKAVIEARALLGLGRPLVLQLSTTSLDLALQTSGSLTLGKSTGDALSVTAITEDASWLSVEPVTGTPSSGLGTYILRIDRSGLTPARYEAAVLFHASNGTQARLTVRMQVLADGSATVGDLGGVYVLLVDENDPDADPRTELATYTPGVGYSYRFDGLPEGSYRVFAGTDYDNDGFICDGGEACGGYPTLDQTAVVDLTSSRAGVDFLASPDFGLALSGATSLSPKGNPIPVQRGFRRTLDLPVAPGQHGLRR